MNNTMPATWQNSLQLSGVYTLDQIVIFLPRVLGAILVVLFGMIAARIFRKVVIKTLETFRLTKAIEKTPIELFFKNAEMGQKLEDVIGGIFYWCFLFFVLYTTVSVLGLTPLSSFMDKILNYVPHILSALLIFIFGVLLAGVAESVVKGGMRSVDLHGGRVLAKVVSYGVVTIAVLMAIAELGIASEFIKILFFGVVFAFSLGCGLAIGLGGQHTVQRIMDQWNRKD